METDSTTEEPTEVNLTEEEWERLREIERLSEENESEETIRVEAWDDLSDYGFADLEAFIEAAKEKRTRLSEKYREAYQQYNPSSAAYIGAVESKAQLIAEWRASEEVYQFYRTTIPVDAKLRRARVRGEVAEEIRERRLLGYEVPSSPPDDQLMTPLSEYDPSDTAEKLLMTIAKLEGEYDLRGEANKTGVYWYAAREMKGEDPDDNNLDETLRGDLKREDLKDHMPGTPEELVDFSVDLYQRWTNVGPFSESS